MWSPDGGVGPFARLGEHAYPAGGYFSVKKSNQKSLGEDPETPYASVRPDRKVCDLPERGLNGAYKVPRRICPLPASPASGEGNALPFAASRQPR